MSDLILPKIMPKYKIMQGRPARSEFRREGLVARAVQISPERGFERPGGGAAEGGVTGLGGQVPANNAKVNVYHVAKKRNK